MKSAIICVAKPCRQAYRTGRRIGGIWHLDENMPIFFDIRQWISHYESANSISEAIRNIANTIG